MSHDRTQIITGVIEGFYGQPWSEMERSQLFDSMAGSGLGTYLYAPKDDLKHRSLWRSNYSGEEIIALTRLVERAKTRGLQFIYALAPGLDICYSDSAELDRIKSRFDQMLQAGANGLAILFDDIPDRLNVADQARFGTFSKAQCFIANEILRWLRARDSAAPLLFCPTPYCGRMAERGLGGNDYLATLGRELDPEIDVFWTGPEIISRSISVEHIRDVAALLLRKPVIWDNLHANDYDGSRFFCGPYSGRSHELLQEVRGIMMNPNCEFPLNFVPLRTLGMFLHNPQGYLPREAYLAALCEWQPSFETIHGPADPGQLTLLGDCYYLPHEFGETATAFLANANKALRSEADAGEAGNFGSAAARFRAFCGSLAELRDRPLFYALSRRVWDLREELDLFERFTRFHAAKPESTKPFTSDFHLPGTYRGGFVPRLQKLLSQNDDGTFTRNLSA